MNTTKRYKFSPSHSSHYINEQSLELLWLTMIHVILKIQQKSVCPFSKPFQRHHKRRDEANLADFEDLT